MSKNISACMKASLRGKICVQRCKLNMFDDFARKELTNILGNLKLVETE